MNSGMIGDKEVEMHRLAKFVWAIDIVRHTSDDTKELVEGWEVRDEHKALTLYNEKVKELQEMIDTDKYEELTIDDWYKMNHHDWKDVVNEYNDLLAEVKRLREEIKDYDACLQNLWDKELIPEDTDIWDEVKELLEVD